MELCETDCKWGSWSAWSQCSDLCGNGTQERNRTKEEATNNGMECLGHSAQQQNCTMETLCVTTTKASPAISTTELPSTPDLSSIPSGSPLPTIFSSYETVLKTNTAQLETTTAEMTTATTTSISTDVTSLKTTSQLETTMTSTGRTTAGEKLTISTEQSTALETTHIFDQSTTIKETTTSKPLTIHKLRTTFDPVITTTILEPSKTAPRLTTTGELVTTETLSTTAVAISGAELETTAIQTATPETTTDNDFEKTTNAEITTTAEQATIAVEITSAKPAAAAADTVGPSFTPREISQQSTVISTIESAQRQKQTTLTGKSVETTPSVESVNLFAPETTAEDGAMTAVIEKSSLFGKMKMFATTLGIPTSVTQPKLKESNLPKERTVKRLATTPITDLLATHGRTKTATDINTGTQIKQNEEDGKQATEMADSRNLSTTIMTADVHIKGSEEYGKQATRSVAGSVSSNTTQIPDNDGNKKQATDKPKLEKSKNGSSIRDQVPDNSGSKMEGTDKSKMGKLNGGSSNGTQISDNEGNTKQGIDKSKMGKLNGGSSNGTQISDNETNSNQGIDKSKMGKLNDGSSNGNQISDNEGNPKEGTDKSKIGNLNDGLSNPNGTQISDNDGNTNQSLHKLSMGKLNEDSFNKSQIPDNEGSKKQRAGEIEKGKSDVGSSERAQIPENEGNIEQQTLKSLDGKMDYASTYRTHIPDNNEIIKQGTNKSKLGKLDDTTSNGVNIPDNKQNLKKGTGKSQMNRSDDGSLEFSDGKGMPIQGNKEDNSPITNGLNDGSQLSKQTSADDYIGTWISGNKLVKQPKDCKLNIASEWSECGKTCGIRYTRNRWMTSSMKGCTESKQEVEKCPFKTCSKDCSWKPWGQWGLCDVTCGNGTLQRYRGVANQPTKDGAPCKGRNVESKSCHTDCTITPTTLAPEIESVITDAGIDESTVVEPLAAGSAVLDSLPFMVDMLPEHTKKMMGHTLSESVPMCMYNGKECDLKKDFKPIYDPTLGNCFTFNHELPSQFISHRAGSEYGLTLLLQGSQNEYLCTSQSAGFKILVHNATEHPFPDSVGYYISPGTSNNIALTQNYLSRLPPPYGNCRKNEELGDYYYNGTFTVEGCLRSCFQNLLTKNCRCGDPRYPLPKNGSHKACNLSKKTCLDFYRTCQADFIETAGCKCSNPCVESIFDATLTTSKLHNMTIPENTCSRSHKTPKDIFDCLKTTRQNFAMVKIFYARLNSRVFIETPAYTFYQLSSDFGGLMGIVLGPSAITFVEFGYCVVGLIVYMLTKGRTSVM